MIETTVHIINKLGLHARPAAMLVQSVARFKSSIKILKEDQEVDGKSIMGIMTLAAAYDSTLRIMVDGSDEKEATQAIIDLFASGFGEK